jgi:hypothetical protein
VGEICRTTGASHALNERTSINLTSKQAPHIRVKGQLHLQTLLHIIAAGLLLVLTSLLCYCYRRMWRDAETYTNPGDRTMMTERDGTIPVLLYLKYLTHDLSKTWTCLWKTPPGLVSLQGKIARTMLSPLKLPVQRCWYLRLLVAQRLHYRKITCKALTAPPQSARCLLVALPTNFPFSEFHLRILGLRPIFRTGMDHIVPPAGIHMILRLDGYAIPQAWKLLISVIDLKMVSRLPLLLIWNVTKYCSFSSLNSDSDDLEHEDATDQSIVFPSLSEWQTDRLQQDHVVSEDTDSAVPLQAASVTLSDFVRGSEIASNTHPHQPGVEGAFTGEIFRWSRSRA